MSNFKKVLATFLAVILTVEAQAAFDGKTIDKKELEARTRGGVLKQRLADRQIRVLCQDSEAAQDGTCQQYGFYYVSKQKGRTYDIKNMDESSAGLSKKDVDDVLGMALILYYPKKKTFKQAMMLIMVLLFPPLIIPMAIAAAFDNVGDSIRNARINDFNRRLERYRRNTAADQDKKIGLSKRKFEMAAEALLFGLRSN